MFKYCIRKFLDYYVRTVDTKEEKYALALLNSDEERIYKSMGRYDKYHCIEVYKKLKGKGIPTLYLKLAVLHDCGKGNASFLIRILHKLGFKTKLRMHPELGYEKVKYIDENLANLIKNHHNKSTNDEYLLLFMEADDRS